MTSFREEEFQDYEDEEDTVLDKSGEAEGREAKSEPASKETPNSSIEDIIRAELVQPLATKTGKDNSLEVSTEKVAFKTKCQLIQLEAENGTLRLYFSFS